MHQSWARLLARPIPSFREGAKGTLGPMGNAPNHDKAFYPCFQPLMSTCLRGIQLLGECSGGPISHRT